MFKFLYTNRRASALLKALVASPSGPDSLWGTTAYALEDVTATFDSTKEDVIPAGSEIRMNVVGEQGTYASTIIDGTIQNVHIDIKYMHKLWIVKLDGLVPNITTAD